MPIYRDHYSSVKYLIFIIRIKIADLIIKIRIICYRLPFIFVFTIEWL